MHKRAPTLKGKGATWRALPPTNLYICGSHNRFEGRERGGIWLPFRVMLQEVVSNWIGIVLWFGAHNQMESDSRWDRSDDGRLESMISGIRASGKLWIRGSEVIGVVWCGVGVWVGCVVVST